MCPPRTETRWRVRALAVGLLLAVSVVGPALASPQPDVVCDVCGEQFEAGAADVGVNVTVTHSTADVRLYDNGTAVWTVRNDLTAESADRLRESETTPSTVTVAAFETYPEGPVDEPTSVETTLADRTVTVRYRDAAPVTRSFGTYLVEYFDTNGYDYWFILNADRLSVVGPAGTTVTNQPSKATVHGRTVTWEGDSGERYDGSGLYDGARIVYTPTDGSAPGLRTTAALWADTLPIYLGNLGSFVLPTTVVFSGLALAGLVAARRFGGRFEPSTLGKGLAALGSLTAVAAVGIGATSGALNNASGWMALGIVVAVVGAAAARRPTWVETPTRAAVTGLGGVLVGVLAAVPVVLVAGSPGGGMGLAALARLAVLLFPVGLAPAAGLLVGIGTRRGLAMGWSVLVAAFALAGAVVVPVADRPFGLIILVMLAGAVLAAVALTPLATLGVGVASD